MLNLHRVQAQLASINSRKALVGSACAIAYPFRLPVMVKRAGCGCFSFAHTLLADAEGSETKGFRVGCNGSWVVEDARRGHGVSCRALNVRGKIPGVQDAARGKKMLLAFIGGC